MTRVNKRVAVSSTSLAVTTRTLTRTATLLLYTTIWYQGLIHLSDRAYRQPAMNAET